MYYNCKLMKLMNIPFIIILDAIDTAMPGIQLNIVSNLNT